MKIAFLRTRNRNQKPKLFSTPTFAQARRLSLIASGQWASAKGELPPAQRIAGIHYRQPACADLRSVDGSLPGSTGLLKIFTAEEEMNVYLLVDTSHSMAQGNPVKIDYAKQVAAALGYIGLKNLDRVGGASFSSVLHKPLTLGRGRKQILSLFNFLARLSCHGKPNCARRSRFYHFVSSPWLRCYRQRSVRSPAGARLSKSSNQKIPVLDDSFVDRQELDPACGDVALRDFENGRERKLFLDDSLVRRYRRELENYSRDRSVAAGDRYLRHHGVPSGIVLQTLRG